MPPSAGAACLLTYRLILQFCDGMIHDSLVLTLVCEVATRKCNVTELVNYRNPKYPGSSLALERSGPC